MNEVLAVVANLAPAVAVALILCYFGWRMVKILAAAIDNLSTVLQSSAKENRETTVAAAAELREIMREHDGKMSERNKAIFDILRDQSRDIAIIMERTKE